MLMMCTLTRHIALDELTSCFSICARMRFLGKDQLLSWFFAFRPQRGSLTPIHIIILRLMRFSTSLLSQKLGRNQVCSRVRKDGFSDLETWAVCLAAGFFAWCNDVTEYFASKRTRHVSLDSFVSYFFLHPPSHAHLSHCLFCQPTNEIQAIAQRSQPMLCAILQFLIDCVNHQISILRRSMYREQRFHRETLDFFDDDNDVNYIFLTITFCVYIINIELLIYIIKLWYRVVFKFIIILYW